MGQLPGHRIGLYLHTKVFGTGNDLKHFAWLPSSVKVCCDAVVQCRAIGDERTPSWVEEGHVNANEEKNRGTGEILPMHLLGSAPEHRIVHGHRWNTKRLGECRKIISVLLRPLCLELSRASFASIHPFCTMPGLQSRCTCSLDRR